MADEKISAMTSATTLDGTELVPLVQGGANVKGTVADLFVSSTPLVISSPVFSVDSAGNLATNTVGALTVSATGPAAGTTSSSESRTAAITALSTAGVVDITTTADDATTGVGTITLTGTDVGQMAVAQGVISTDKTKTTIDATAGNLLLSASGTGTITIDAVNKLLILNLPTSAAGLPTGALWNNLGVLNIA